MRCCKCLGGNVSIGGKEQHVASTLPDVEFVPLRDREDILAGRGSLASFSCSEVTGITEVEVGSSHKAELGPGSGARWAKSLRRLALDTTSRYKKLVDHQRLSGKRIHAASILPESPVVVRAADAEADIVILPVSAPVQHDAPTTEHQNHRKAPSREQKLKQRRKEIVREEEERLAQTRQQPWHYTDPSRKQRQQMEGPSVQSKQWHHNGQILITMAQLDDVQLIEPGNAHEQTTSQPAGSGSKTRTKSAHQHWHVPELHAQASLLSDGNQPGFSDSASDFAPESSSDTISGVATAGMLADLSRMSIGRTTGKGEPSYTVDSIAVWLKKPDLHLERSPRPEQHSKDNGVLAETEERVISNSAAGKHTSPKGDPRGVGRIIDEAAVPGGAACVRGTQQRMTSYALNNLVDGSDTSSSSQRNGLGHANSEEAQGEGTEEAECEQQAERFHTEAVQARSCWVGCSIKEAFRDVTGGLPTLESVRHPSRVVEGEAVAVIWRIMRSAIAGQQECQGPQAVFAFAEGGQPDGPQQAMMAALQFYGSESKVVRMDMRACRQADSIAKLTGTEGAQEPQEVEQLVENVEVLAAKMQRLQAQMSILLADNGGAADSYVPNGLGEVSLADSVRREPYTVVLFEMVEAAHPDVLNLILQILETGMLLDAQGRTVDFRHAVVAFTTSVGYAATEPGLFGPGFQLHAQDPACQRTGALAEMQLRALFSPVHLVWLPHISSLWRISRGEVKAITDLMLQEVCALVRTETGTDLRIEEDFRDALVDVGYSSIYAHGIQPLRRAIKQLIEDTLADWAGQGRTFSASGHIDHTRANLSLGVGGRIVIAFVPRDS